MLSSVKNILDRNNFVKTFITIENAKFGMIDRSDIIDLRRMENIMQ